jgi:hypothetical protein
VAVSRPQPGDTRRQHGSCDRTGNHLDRLHLEQQRSHQKRGFHAFPADHQQRETEDAQEG